MLDGGFKLGKIFGIELRLDKSWILIFLLVTWNLAGGVFPTIHPDWSASLSWIIGITASLLFFVSVLVHELAHSLIAKSRGLKVSRIVLFLFGGVSDLEQEPDSPKTEFLVAIVGPFTSLAIGILCLSWAGRLPLDPNGLGEVTINLSQAGPIPTMLVWLGSVNILLAAFNSIPGFPLDGGRVLRSLLWGISKNLHMATRIASGMGQILALFFIGSGFAMVLGAQVPILGGGLLNGLWLVVIGWFLNNAAEQGYEQTVMQSLLQKIPVSRLMRSDATKISPALSVSNLINKHVLKKEENAFPVVKNGHLAGLVCVDNLRDLPQADWKSTKVANIMIPAKDIDTTVPEESASNALSKIEHTKACQIAVLKKGKVVGLLSRREIELWLKLHSSGQNGEIKREELRG